MAPHFHSISISLQYEFMGISKRYWDPQRKQAGNIHDHPNFTGKPRASWRSHLGQWWSIVVVLDVVYIYYIYIWYMYVYIYMIYIYDIYIYMIYIYIYTYVHIYIYVCTYIYIYLYIYDICIYDHICNVYVKLAYFHGDFMAISTNTGT